MKHKFFKVPVHGGPAEEELNQFTSSHQVVGVERQLVVDGSNSFWALCIRYLDGGETNPVTRKGKIDYREILSEEEFAVFARLRELRKQMSEREGLPPYALFTNEQLAAMIRTRVRTKHDMLQIDGIGAARIDKYAPPVLEVLAELSQCVSEASKQ